MTTSHFTMALALAGCALLSACGSADESDDAVATAASDEATQPVAATDEAPAADASESPAPEAGATPVAEPSESPAVATPEPKPTASAAPKVAAAPAAFTQCKVCHSTEPGKNLIGPSLAGIFGTKAGDVAGFNFSTAMKESGLTWNEKTLDSFLKSPREVIPGTRMTFAGLKKDEDRAAIIAYIKTLK
ncbi:MAG: c-type cytochrome [Caenibius sp.]